MKRPFLHIFMFYIAGILFYNKFDVDISFIKLLLLLTIFFIFASIILIKRLHLIKYILLLPFFLLAIIASDYSVEQNKLPKIYDESVKATAIVKEIISKEEDYSKYLLYVNKVKYKDEVYSIEEKLILKMYGGKEIAVGDKIFGNIDIKEANRNTNPKLFNYKRHLESKGIFATGSTKDYNIKVLSHGNLNKFENLSIKVKDHINFVLDKSLRPDNSSILKSIILGDSSLLEEEELESFRKLGLSHILAVSGLHIGIIFAFILSILSIFKIHRRKSITISIIIIWIYAVIIGAPPSVLRASLMFSFLAASQLTYKRYDALNILSLSGFILLIYRPSTIFSVGFQLSFIATATIFIFMPKMLEIITIKNKKIKATIALLLTVQIGILPISLYYFNELQILSIISNLIIAPLLTISVVIGFLIILSSIVSIKIAMIIGVLGNIVLNISTFLIAPLSKMTTMNIWIRSPSFIEIIFYYLILLILLKIINLQNLDKRIQHYIYLNTAIAIILYLSFAIKQDNIKMEFIDVGQGDACLVRFKDKNILIDTGGNIFGDFDIGENILLPYLRKTGVKTLDAVFISHFHADHCKGLQALFGELDIKNIFIGYKNSENELYRDIVASSKLHSSNIKLISKGDILKIADNAHVEVIESSGADHKYSDENDNSLVFVLKTYDYESLFTGDVEEKSEDYIIGNTKRRNIDIIKVPHHGSKTSSKDEFIKHFNPKVAVIQVGKNNFGHPNADVLNRYHKNSTKILRNDQLGLITIDIRKDNMMIKGYLKDKLSFTDWLLEDIYISLYVLYSGTIFLLVLEYKRIEDKELKC